MSTGIVQPLEQDWGRRVKDRRTQLGLSQHDLAQSIGGSTVQQTISKIESGLIAPRDSLKVAIAQALGTRPHLLFPWPEQDAS